MIFREFKEKTSRMPFFRSDIADTAKGSPAGLRNQLSRWKARGWVVELKRGLYILGPGDRTTQVSREVIAATLFTPSYISLETALSRYQMIPERVDAVTSVTTKKTKTFHNPEGVFIYQNLKVSLFFGFVERKDENGFPYLLAEPEKALLDHVYLNLGKIDPGDRDYFEGSLRLQNRSILDRKKLSAYASRFDTKKLDAILEGLS